MSNLIPFEDRKNEKEKEQSVEEFINFLMEVRLNGLEIGGLFFERDGLAICYEEALLLTASLLSFYDREEEDVRKDIDMINRVKKM